MTDSNNPAPSARLLMTRTLSFGHDTIRVVLDAHGDLVIEERRTDAMGAERWNKIGHARRSANNVTGWNACTDDVSDSMLCALLASALGV